MKAFIQMWHTLMRYHLVNKIKATKASACSETNLYTYSTAFLQIQS